MIDQVSQDDADAGGFLAGGGELGGLIRAHDWSTTSLGPPSQWPHSLLTAVRIMLTSRQPIWIGWGRELIYLYNDPYKSIIGGKHPWALGRPTSEVWREIWPDIGPMLATAMGGVEGTYVEEQLLIMERHGYPEETYYTFSYSPIPDDDGAPGGIICANTDDTQRVIGERQLALLRDLAETAAQSRSARDACLQSAVALASNPQDIPFGLIYLRGPQGTVAELAGASGLQPGHAAAPVSLPLDAPLPWPIAEAMAGGRPVLVDRLRDQFPDLPVGAWSQAPDKAVILPIPASGDTGHGGALVVGLSPHRLFNEGYRDFLNLTVNQIASAIASADAYAEERRRAEALAELDLAKTAFFSNVSHEFRTPLTLMLAPLEEVLSGAVAPDDVAQQVELAHRNGARLLRLVNSLLDFSRIEAGRMRARFERTDVGLFTAEIASSFRSAMEKAGLSYEVSVQPLVADAYLDRDLWEKVVLNLISNAFKFTFEGGVSVQVRAAPDGDAALISVSDTGIGVAADELPRLFERFHRIEGAQGRSFEGSGIGLALVHELVALHGGGISATSELGRGTTFTIRMPYGRTHLPPEQVIEGSEDLAFPQKAHEFVDEALRWLGNAALPSNPPLPNPAPQSGQPKRIVLADDNGDMRDYVNRLLKGQGFQVEAVADGRQALEAVRRQRPDLLLTDVMMPGLDGFGLLKAIREDADIAATPVILLSARAGEEARVEGFEAGADDYLIKPFSARELLAQVTAHIQLATVRREAEEALRRQRAELQDQTQALQALNRAASAVSGDLDLDRLVQTITDTGVEVSGAEFGAFFYNLVDEAGESYTLYTLSGAPRSAFERFPMPRNTKVFAPTFDGTSVIRSDDITKDPRYGHSEPYRGMPEGHLPVRSYLAVPVRSRGGEVLGGLFFGHSTPGVFTATSEERLVGLASQAAVAMDNAALFKTVQHELAQRRAAEAELQALNTGLEARIETALAERARAEEALRQAQKMEAVGQLTGGVAHDFNNLLTVIIGGLETIRRAKPGDDARIKRSVDLALHGAQRAANLTSRLLAFSRRQPLAPRPLDLNHLVRDMTELLHRTLGETIEMEGVLAPRLWTIEADQNQLESAILNLAVNARDAMPEGGKLTLETANTVLDQAYAATDAEVAPGQYVMIAISDTGGGMAPDTLERAFEPFFTTKDVGRGTGLGLSMVYGFVKQSGGHVTLYSEPGQGTTVKLYFPRYFGALQSDAVAGEADAPTSSDDETVLVVEDNQDVRTYSVMILSELGYQVLEAADADAALEVLREERRVDLLFTDVVLPGRSGRVLADEARTLRPDLKVLFTTGYSRNAIVHHGRLDPGVQLVTKPFTFEELAVRVREVLDRG
jgi:signal transduction histidine kinase/DNA-binding response OmpR family regulator